VEKWRCIGEPLLLLDRKMINKAAQGVHGLHNVALKELRGALARRRRSRTSPTRCARCLVLIVANVRIVAANVHVSMFFVGCAGVRYLPNVGWRDFDRF
tara:strand:- start:20 stop:316 length:297 start_codon:yes stop_codon:yes gene_type:complete